MALSVELIPSNSLLFHAWVDQRFEGGRFINPLRLAKQAAASPLLMAELPPFSLTFTAIRALPKDGVPLSLQLEEAGHDGAATMVELAGAVMDHFIVPESRMLMDNLNRLSWELTHHPVMVGPALPVQVAANELEQWGRRIQRFLARVYPEPLPPAPPTHHKFADRTEDRRRVYDRPVEVHVVRVFPDGHDHSAADRMPDPVVPRRRILREVHETQKVHQ